jgi:hypothetical protein
MSKTFEQIVDAVQQWMVIDQEDNAERLPDAVVEDIINGVIDDYCQRRESRFQETSDTFQTVISPLTRDYAAPTGWKPRKLWYAPSTGGVKVLTYLDKDVFDITYPDKTQTDDPVAYTEWAGNIQLGPTPSTVITINRDYYRRLSALAAGSPYNENAFTQQAYQYLLFASLVKACEFGLEDERLPIWVGEAARAEAALDLEDARRKTVPRRSQSTEPG